MSRQYMFKAVIPIFLLNLCTYTIDAQDNLYREDLTVCWELLKAYHPTLYKYESEEHYEDDFNQLVSSVEDDYSLLVAACQLIEKAGCGHTGINPSPVFMDEMVNTALLFPLPVRLINDKLYAVEGQMGVQPGDEILEINGKHTDFIIQEMFKVLTADGRNKAGKVGQVNNSFGINYHLLYPQEKRFNIRTTSGKDQLDGLPFVDVVAINEQVNLIKQFNNDNRAYHLKEINDSTSLLTVNTFMYETEEEINYFKMFIKVVFDELNRKKTPHLIIDVRNNQGGLRELAIYLYGFLTDKEFKQRNKVCVKDWRTISEYMVMDQRLQFDEIAHEFKQYYGNSLCQSSDHLKELMQPAHPNYKGQVIVLVGNNTFSAGGEFALNCKNNTDIILMGQETGAAYECHNGDFSYVFELPNSRHQIRIPSTHISHFNEADNKGRIGIYPDIEVKTSIEAFINGEDRQLKEAMGLF